MKTKNFAILFLSMLIISCTIFKKDDPIETFTKKINVKNPSEINLPKSSRKTDFSNPINFVNENIFPVAINNINNKNVKVIKIPSKMLSKPAIFGSDLYYIDIEGNVIKFSLKTQKLLWSYNYSINKKKPTTSNILIKDNILFATLDTNFFLLNTENGREISSSSTKDLIKVQPLAFNDNLAIQNISNELYIVNIKNWALKWNAQTWSESLSTQIDFSPIFTGKHLISSFTSGVINAFNPENGEIIWSYNQTIDIDDSNFTPSNATCQPLLDDHYLYFPSSSGNLLKINHENGNLVFKEKYEDIHAMSQTDKYLFTIDNAMQLTAISKANGEAKWMSKLIPESGKHSSTQFFTPIISSEKIYVPSQNGILYVVSTTDGKILSYITIPKNFDKFAIWDNSLLIIQNNKIYLYY